MIIQDIRERFTVFAQSNEPTGAAHHSSRPISCDGDQLEGRQFCLANKPMKALKISSPLVCPFNGKMVSSSSFGAHVFKNHPDENTQLCHIHHISRLVKLEGKALTHINILPQMLLHIHSHSLTSPCSGIAGELHFFNGLHDLCFIFKVVKKAIRRLEKGFLRDIADFEWLLVFSKDVTDAVRPIHR